MPENRKDLIEKLKSLNPTSNNSDGTWSPDFSNTSDDANLILLAPSMREELLKMEEEMELRNNYYEDKIEALYRIISEKERELEITYQQLKQRNTNQLSSSEKGLCRICGDNNCDSDSHK